MRKESKNWKLIKNKEIFDFSNFDSYSKGYLITKGSHSNNYIKCEDCSNNIKEEEKWEAFQWKSKVERVVSNGRDYYRLLDPNIEFYCFKCQIAEGEKGGSDDVLPQIQAKNKKSLIESELEAKEEEEKNEFGESSEQGRIEKIKQLEEGIAEMAKLLEQIIEEKRKLSKEDENQENTQKIKRLEEEIKQLEKKINQQKQELDEIKKNAQLSLGTITK